MNQKKTKEEKVFDAWRERERLEAITENTRHKYGRVSNSLAQELLFAQISYAVEKDNRSDPYLKDE